MSSFAAIIFGYDMIRYDRASMAHARRLYFWELLGFNLKTRLSGFLYTIQHERKCCFPRSPYNPYRCPVPIMCCVLDRAHFLLSSVNLSHHLKPELEPTPKSM